MLAIANNFENIPTDYTLESNMWRRRSATRIEGRKTIRDGSKMGGAQAQPSHTKQVKLGDYTNDLIATSAVSILRRYRCRRKADPPLGKYEYSDSGNMFVQFLSNRKPFSNVFDKKLGREFYANVRCGLLHEARTKDGWTIWAKGPANMLVSASTKIAKTEPQEFNFRVADQADTIRPQTAPRLKGRNVG